jgi:hypothetical protein
VNTPALKETPLHKRLRQLGEYAKRLETGADAKLMEARVSHGEFRDGKIKTITPTLLKRAAAVCWAGIYRRRAKLARRDEKRLAKVAAVMDRIGVRRVSGG